MEKIEHDGQGWRLHLVGDTTDLVFTIERECDGVWVPAQRWTTPRPDPKRRRAAVAESARAHGWITPTERWPRQRKDGVQIIDDLFPFDWRKIVADTTQLRSETLEQAGLIDSAWRATIRDAEKKGLSVEELGTLSRRGRHAIYRMRDGGSGQPVDEEVLLREARTEKRRG